MSTAIADRRTGTKAKLAGVAAASAALASTAVVLAAPSPAVADEYDCAYQATLTSDYFYSGGQNWYAESAAQLKSGYTGCIYIYAMTAEACGVARLRYIGEGNEIFLSPTHAVCQSFYLNLSVDAISSGTKFRIESRDTPEGFHLRY